MDFNEQFMKRAIALSRKKMRLGCGGPFGALIVNNNDIVAEGWNEVTSKNDPTAHAEVNVIRKACKKLKKFRLDNCQLYSSCEPCPMCLSAIYWSGITVVFYANSRQDAAKIGFADDYIYQELMKKNSERKIKMVCTDNFRNEAIEVFTEWQQKIDKKHY